MMNAADVGSNEQRHPRQPKQSSLDWCNDDCQRSYRWKHDGCLPSCGCGTGHKMEPFGEIIVHFEGQHWVLDCLTQKLIHDRRQDRNVIRILNDRMKRHLHTLASMRCSRPNCNNRVGKNYRLENDG